MKILIVGASGKIGREIDKALSADFEIVRVGATSGDYQCDFTSNESVIDMFEAVGIYDHLIAVVGADSQFKKFEELNDDDYRYGFERKFLGQVRLATHGQVNIRDKGSITLTSGFLKDYPNRFSIATGPLNSAVDTYVKNTAPLMLRGVRINVVSPAPIVEPGREGEGLITAAQCADYYVDAVSGDMTGKVLRAWGGLPPIED